MEAQKQPLSEEELQRQIEKKCAACQLAKAARRIAHLDLVINNLEQLVEAYGDDNRHFAGEGFHHSPTQEQAWEYYETHGGTVGHRERVEARARLRNPPQPSTEIDPEAPSESTDKTTNPGT